MNASEIFVSVDIETSGPVPGLFSLLSIGACLVHAPDVRFYAELKLWLRSTTSICIPSWGPTDLIEVSSV